MRRAAQVVGTSAARPCRSCWRWWRVAVVVLLALVPLARAGAAASAGPHRGRRGGAGRRRRGRGRRAARWRAANGAELVAWRAAGRSTCGSWSRSATPAPRPRPVATADAVLRERHRGCPTLGVDAPRRAWRASRPTRHRRHGHVRTGVEPADAPTAATRRRRPRRDADEPRRRTRPARRVAPAAAGAGPRRPGSRRPKAPQPAQGAGPQGQAHRAPRRAVVGAEDLGAVLPVDLPDHLRGIGACCGTPRAARASIDDVESFVTSLGLRELRGHRRRAGHHAVDDPVDDRRRRPAARRGSTRHRPSRSRPPTDELSTIPDEDGECAEGQRLVGGFKFEDERIFQSFALGGVVLVLAGAAVSVVLALLFNLISDLTGGVRVTVLEEEPARVPYGLARLRPAATNFAAPAARTGL